MEDVEEKVLKIYENLKKEDVLNQWKGFSKSVMKYLEKEWSPENPPTTEEIQSVAETFLDNNAGNINDVMKKVNADDFSFLLTFMIVGFDTIINGDCKNT